MSHESSPPPVLNWPVSDPRPFLFGGLGLLTVAVGLSHFAPDSWVVVRVLLIILGLVSTGAAVSLRLAAVRWDDGEDRLRSAGLVVLAAVGPFAAGLACDPAWDACRVATTVLTAVALGGAGLILLPQTARRVVISLLVLYHFGGILMAVTSVPPPNSHPPWMTTQIWTRFYRPYLQFMYLNNAYHFYSPEPGPPTLLWFYIQYEKGSSRWVKIPNREDFRTRLEFQRRLALTESTNSLAGPAVDFEQRWYRRLQAGSLTNPPIPPYPPHLMPLIQQHREPMPYSKHMIRAYARYAARNYPHEQYPEKKVVAVKVYRVIHQILIPTGLLECEKPDDLYNPTTYQPFYVGEFDSDGNMLDPEDPFLYWVIPIVAVPREPQGHFRVNVPPQGKVDLEIRDYLEVHAKSPTVRRQPGKAP